MKTRLELEYFPLWIDDWLTSQKLRTVSLAAKGALVDILCCAYRSPDPGYLAVAMEDGEARYLTETQASCLYSASSMLLAELVDAGVICKDDKGYYSPKARIEAPESLRRAEMARERARKGGIGKAAKANHPENPASSMLQADSEHAPSMQTVDHRPETIDQTPRKEGLPLVGVPTSSSSATAVDPAPKVPDCPQQEILDLYHRILPELPRMRTWGPDRQANLRSRWREDPKRQDLAWWETLFTWIRKSDFLMGRSMPVQGRPVFLASLAWLTLPRNWGKLQDGAYHREAKNMSRQEWAFAKAMDRINAETDEEVQ